MSYPIDSLGIKVKRADHHIKDCRIALQHFMGNKPYEIVRQLDSQSGERVYVVNKADPVPRPISGMVGDALQNLRTALDYLAHALVFANGKRPTKDTSFPILKGDIGSEIYKPIFDRKVDGMRDDAIEKIKSLKPYKGGNDILWGLHALNNRDKHRLLLVAGSGVSVFSSQPLSQDVVLDPEKLEKALADRFIRIPGAFPLYKGQEILIDATHLKADEDVTLFGEVAISETEIIEPVPLIVLLRKSYRHIFRIITDFQYLLR